MTPNLFDSFEVDPDEFASAKARCYLALGRLDGAIAHAAPSVVAMFALMLVRRTGRGPLIFLHDGLEFGP